MIVPIEYLYRNGTLVVGNTWRGPAAVVDRPYSGFTLCGYTGDETDHVDMCRGALASTLGVGVECLVVPRQVHGVRVAVIGSDISADLDGYDAVVSARRRIVLGVNTADCVPVLMADPQAGIVAAAHAGWRGAVAHVQLRALEKMVRLGADVSNVHVWMGPCICRSCFEVGEEVAARFPKDFVECVSGLKPHVDLAAMVASDLISAGVGPACIDMPKGCTRCSPGRYFSARASGVSSGRIYSFIYRP